MRTLVDLIVFTLAGALILGGLWLIWNTTAEAWQEWRR
jgi:hypothetical protein